MSVWDELLKIEAKDKAKMCHLFKELVVNVKNWKTEFKDEIKEHEDHYIVTEENRAGSYFVNLVPKECFELFRKMQRLEPYKFLGYSVLVGRRDNKEIRVSCFGVPCSDLGRTLKNLEG